MDHSIVYNIHSHSKATDHTSLCCREPEHEWLALTSLTHPHKMPHTFYLCQMAHDEHVWNLCRPAASNHNKTMKHGKPQVFAVLQHSERSLRDKEKNDTVNLFYTLKWNGYCLPDNKETYNLQGSSECITSWQVKRVRWWSRRHKVKTALQLWKMRKNIETEKYRQQKYAALKYFISVLSVSPSVSHVTFLVQESTSDEPHKNDCYIPLYSGLNRSCQSLFFQLMSA